MRNVHEGIVALSVTIEETKGFMIERRQGLAPFVSQFKHCPPEYGKPVQTESPKEWKEVHNGRTLVYKIKNDLVRIYEETISEDGTPQLKYLPYDTLDYALAELEKTLPPLPSYVLNFLIR